MRRELFGLAILAWAAIFPSMTEAQDPAKPKPSLLERFDDFTTSLLGGNGSERDRPAKPPKAPVVQKSLYRTAPRQNLPQPAAAPAAEPTLASPVPTSSPDVPAAPAAQPPRTGEERPPRSPVLSEADESPSRPTLTHAPGSSPSGLPPLHERLAGFRQSLFGKSSEAAAETKPSGISKEEAIAPAAPVPAATAAGRSSEDTTAAPRPVISAVQPPAIKDAAPPTVAAPMASPIPLVAAGPRAAIPRPLVFGPAVAAPSSTVSPPSPPIAPIVTGPTISSPLGAGSAADRPRPGNDSGVFTRQSPVLTIETVGPRRISVGKEAAYEIALRNTGEIAADQVIVSIEIPGWTEVTGAEASVGVTSPASAGQGGGPFLWKVGRVEARGREKLVLRVIPRQSRPFDLAVKWDCTPATSPTLIEVQEPRLAIALVGPREVLFGKGEVYKLEVTNSGNGDAENVLVSLSPSGPGEKPAAATHPFGKLSAGQKKSIDVELTARQMGKLVIAIEARGDAGLKTELTEEIFVRRAALKVELEAPKVQYVATEATYRIRLINPGTAPASHVAVTATLPAGAKFVSSPQNGRAGSDPNKVVWNLESIAAGSEATLVMLCTIASPGTGRFEVQSTADGDLSATASAVTQVEAVANLVLTVDEPSGPVPVSGEAVYQLNLQNRGTATAEAVEIVTYFSNGIEPVSAEGARNRIGTGQVVFDVVPSVAPSQTLVLKVKAKAEAAGNHIFRVEVNSRAAGTRLVREGTTRFYGAKEGSVPPAVVRPSTPGTSTAEDPRTARH